MTAPKKPKVPVAHPKRQPAKRTPTEHDDADLVTISCYSRIGEVIILGLLVGAGLAAFLGWLSR